MLKNVVKMMSLNQNKVNIIGNTGKDLNIYIRTIFLNLHNLMILYDSRVSEMDTVLLRGVGAGCGSKSTSKTEGQVIASPSTSGAQGRTRRSVALVEKGTSCIADAQPSPSMSGGQVSGANTAPSLETTTSNAGPWTRQSVGRPRSS